LAPMAKAIVNADTTVKVGFFRSNRLP
jgi:hypothetical protein